MADMERMHRILCDLKRVCDDLGRQATKNDYTVCGEFSTEELMRTWPTFNDALKAAGELGRNQAKKDKPNTDALITKSVYDLKSPPLGDRFPILGPYPKIIAIGDIHAPFTCSDSLERIYSIIKSFQPQYVVTMGDEYDFWSMSKFPKQILITPQEEVDAAQSMLTEMFNRIHDACPTAKKYAIRGNHSIRPIKRLIESAPELMPFFEFDKYFQFPNCETILDTRHILEIGGIAFTHGFMRHGQHMKKIGMPTVHGHLHAGGIIQQKFDGRWLWEMDCGYIGNPATVAFNYTAIKETRWTRGVGLIDEWGPHFIPFE